MLWPLRSPEPDIAESSAAEAARLHAAFDSLQTPMLLLDSEARVLDANLAATTSCGLGEGALREDAGGLAGALEAGDLLWLRRAVGQASDGLTRRGRFARLGPPQSGPLEAIVEPVRAGGAVALLTLRALPREPARAGRALGLHAADLAVELDSLCARLGSASPSEQEALRASLERARQELASLAVAALGRPVGVTPTDLVEALVAELRRALPAGVRLRCRSAALTASVVCDRESLLGLGASFARFAAQAGAGEVVLESLRGGTGMLLAFSHDGAPLAPPLIARLSRPNVGGEKRPIDLAEWRALARAWGGELRVGASPGVAFRLELVLPGLIAQPAPPRHPERGLPERVLLVDTEGPFREQARLVLVEAGVGVELADDSIAALDRFEQDLEVDLVLLGMELPTPGPRHILRLFRKLRPDVPVVMVGGYTNVPLVRDCIASGALAVLPRRFRLDELRRALEARD